MPLKTEVCKDVFSPSSDIVFSVQNCSCFTAVLIPRLKEANKHFIIHVAYEKEAFIIKLHHDLWRNS